MKLEVLREIIKKKENKNEFAIVTNLATGNSEVFEKGKPLSKDFEKFIFRSMPVNIICSIKQSSKFC